MIIAAMYPCPYDVQDRHDHNSSIIVNDRLYAYEEDKLTGVKNEGTVRFPERSLMMGFKELKVHPSDVDLWIFPTPAKIDYKSLEFFFTTIVKAFKGKKSDFKSWLHNHTKFVPHQISHASLGIFASNFKNSMFLCMDGGGDHGDNRNFIFGEYTNNKFKIKYQTKGTSNIGSFHAFLTDALGLAANESGKVSGLAGYGKINNELVEKFSSLLTVSKNGIHFARKRYSHTKLNLEKIKPREYNRSKFMNQYPSDNNISRLSYKYLPQDIAATGEFVFREKILELLRLLRLESTSQNIVLGGGVFQNVTLNKYIQESNIFKKCYFNMASGDSGLSLGSALYASSKKNIKNRKNLLSPFIGPSFDESEIERLLNQSRLKYKSIKNIEKEVAKLISQGKCVGWFQGRAEYGPRSLGARSILADPRRIKSKSRINQLLKKRDWFMPYAPSIMIEYTKDFLDQPIKSPYMQIALNIKKSKRKI